MRLTYYRFPENTDENILLENGCAIVLKSGYEIYENTIPYDKRYLVDHVCDTIFVQFLLLKKCLNNMVVVLGLSI